MPWPGDPACVASRRRSAIASSPRSPRPRASTGAAHFEPPKLRMLDRVSQFALVCARQAIEGAADPLNGLDRNRAGVFVGTGMAGSESSDEGYRTLYARRPTGSSRTRS
jgi:3-oxoacyl-[acyl-carrier-protein] synthase II